MRPTRESEGRRVCEPRVGACGLLRIPLPTAEGLSHPVRSLALAPLRRSLCITTTVYQAPSDSRHGHRDAPPRPRESFVPPHSRSRSCPRDHACPRSFAPSPLGPTAAVLPRCLRRILRAERQHPRGRVSMRRAPSSDLGEGRLLQHRGSY